MYGPALKIESIEVIRIFPTCLKVLWCKIPADLTVEFITTRFGNDLHDSAGGFTVLGFEPPGLDLHFFYEREIDSWRQGTVIASEDAEAAKATVGAIHAV